MNSHGLTKENLLFSYPVALQKDPSAIALGDTAAEVLAQRPEEIKRIAIYSLIDKLPEDLLDILAYDFKVDWYDYEYPINTKRALIKGNVLAHKRQGTVYATRSVLDSLYPKSAMEEWFTYGGEPGYFRLNVNVTNSAEDGAVEVYSTEEILRRIATIKRESAHLEGVSYMVRRGIIIKHRVDSWSYRVPECGTIRCGTWWMRKTLGWSERHRLTVGERAELFRISPELSGTLPYIKTPGYSLRGKLLITGQVTGHPAQPQFTGLIRSGTEWMRRTLGWSEQAGALTEGARPEGFTIAPEFAGTLPEQSSKGYTLVCGAVRSGGVVTAFGDNPRESGAPELTGTWPKRAEAGYSIVAKAVRAGGGMEVFRVAPELAGTLPETAVEGYAISGGLSAGANVEGLKITPEYTGTLPKEAQRGERDD